jgi:hypothetical protein
MLQEIITFIIIALAIILTAWRIIGRFRRIKKLKKPGCETEGSDLPDKCYDCREDCIMRNELLYKMKNKPDSGTKKEKDNKK